LRRQEHIGNKWPYYKGVIVATKKKVNPKITKVMKEWKAGTLHSGKGGPVVKSQKQAIAIAISEAKRAKKKKQK